MKVSKVKYHQLLGAEVRYVKAEMMEEPVSNFFVLGTSYKSMVQLVWFSPVTLGTIGSWSILEFHSVKSFLGGKQVV